MVSRCQGLCNQGRKLCPHPFLCNGNGSGGGGSIDTPATPRVPLRRKVIGVLAIAGPLVAWLVLIVVSALQSGAL